VINIVVSNAQIELWKVKHMGMATSWVSGRTLKAAAASEVEVEVEVEPEPEPKPELVFKFNNLGTMEEKQLIIDTFLASGKLPEDMNWQNLKMVSLGGKVLAAADITDEIIDNLIKRAIAVFIEKHRKTPSELQIANFKRLVMTIMHRLTHQEKGETGPPPPLGLKRKAPIQSRVTLANFEDPDDASAPVAGPSSSTEVELDHKLAVQLSKRRSKRSHASTKSYDAMWKA
jgi:hypothetical protein